MSLDLLEVTAEALGPLVSEVAFLGGASIQLWLTDTAAPQARETMDADIVVGVTGYREYAALGDRLRARGFEEDTTSGVICRWTLGGRLILDVMPTDEKILGFSNRWYRRALATAIERRLPSGAVIRAVAPAYLVATKIEAFRDRGRGDYLASADFEDVVRLVDGREELMDEVDALPADVRAFVSASFAEMRGDPLFEYGVAGALLPDAASQARLPLVMERIARLIGAP